MAKVFTAENFEQEVLKSDKPLSLIHIWQERKRQLWRMDICI